MSDPEYDLQHRSDSPIYRNEEPQEPPFVWMDQSRTYQRTLVKEMIERCETRLKSYEEYKSLFASRVKTIKKVKERLENYYEYLRFKS